MVRLPAGVQATMSQCVCQELGCHVLGCDSRPLMPLLNCSWWHEGRGTCPRSHSRAVTLIQGPGSNEAF